tara:strand:- start:109 stop:321 length:213 start_codon:yes stop_codon:yes gene_type:complete
MKKSKLITIDGFTLDERYRVSLQWCGYETPRYVATFCDDEVLGWYDTKHEAEIACLVYRKSQVKSLNFTM